MALLFLFSINLVHLIIIIYTLKCSSLQFFCSTFPNPERHNANTYPEIFYTVTHDDHTMHIKSNMHLEQDTVHTLEKTIETTCSTLNNCYVLFCTERHEIMQDTDVAE